MVFFKDSNSKHKDSKELDSNSNPKEKDSMELGSKPNLKEQDSKSIEMEKGPNPKSPNSNEMDLAKKLEFLEKELLEKESQLAEKETKLIEFKELLQRLQADFENFSKRIEREKTQFVEFSNAKTISNFLPLLDSLDSAAKKLKESKNANQSVDSKIENAKKHELDGIELLHRQLLSILHKSGLSEIKCVGEKFNPEFHDCLQMENVAEKPDETILEELQKGYLLNGKILRHSKVKISKKTN